MYIQKFSRLKFYPEQYTALYRILLLSISLCFSVTAWSLATDKEQTIEIEADNAEFDNEMGLITYHGNVLVTQGSIRISGNTLTMHVKNNQPQTLIIQGQPSRFRQLPDNSDTYDEAQAITMKYHQADDLIVLIGNASLEQAGISVHSEQIKYNITLSKMELGNDNKPQERIAETDSSTDERIKIIIKPKKK